jgi:hypothetical protein
METQRFNHLYNMIRTILLIGLFCGSLHSQTKFTISGKVSQTSSYCGGAPPSKEMLEEFARPEPYSGKTFHVLKPKSKTSLLKFTSDAQGNFSFSLPTGTYTIVLSEQLDKNSVNKYRKDPEYIVDETCLKTWWNKPYYVLTVKNKDVKGLAFEFHHPCSYPVDIPCVQHVPEKRP